MRNPDLAARSIEDVAKLMKENISNETEKYSFLEVKVVDKFDRSEAPTSIPMKGIQKTHHLTLTQDGRIISRELSCGSCIELDGVCPECNANARLVYEPTLTLDEEPGMETLEPGGDGDEEEEELPNVEVDERVDDDNDVTSCVDGEEEHDELDVDVEEEFGPGAIVWAKQRLSIPGTIIDLHSVPQNTKKFFNVYPDSHFIVQLFPPYSDVIIVPRYRITLLGENRYDRKLASKNAQIHEAYSQAICALRGD